MVKTVLDQLDFLDAFTKRIPKASVVFLKVFQGDRGDNVFTFIKQFEQAVVEAQIRESSQVESEENFLYPRLINMSHNIISS